MNRGLLLGAASVCWAATLLSSASAQSLGASSDEVVVTAQKREQTLFEVPLSVQALGAEQLDNAGISTVSELTALIPGSSVVSNSTPGFDTVQIRGISSGTTGDGLVGFYIDDTPFGIPNLQLSPPAGLLDVARVEVLRGPSGTLYGQGSMGGTIKLVTQKPDSTRFSGELRAQGANTANGDPTYGVDGVVNLPILKEKLALRVAGSFQRLGGYADYDDVASPGIEAEDVNDFRGVNIRATALYTPRPDLDFSFTYWFIDNNQDASNTLNSARVEPAILGFLRGPGFTNIDMHLFSGTASWNLGPATLIANSAYIDHSLDFDVPIDVLGLPAYSNDSTFNTGSFTQEVRLVSPTEQRLNWILGAFYRNATIDSDIAFSLDGAALGFPGVTVPVIDVAGPLDTESWSLFGEISWGFLQGRLVPLVGLRYFRDNRSSDGIDRITGLLDSNSATFDSLTPRFNLSYRFSDDVLAFFNAAKGFRSGTLQTDAQAAGADTLLGLPAGTTPSQVDPDELWTYELGAKIKFFNDALNLEASIYRTDWDNVQTQFGAAASLINGGDYKINGFDFGIRWRTPLDGLTLLATGNINSAEIRNAPIALSASLAGVSNGARAPNVPKQNYTVAADYKRMLEFLGGSEFSLYASYAFRDTQNDPTTGVASDNLSDLTLRTGLEIGRWEAEIFALNALNNDASAVVAPVTSSYQILYPRRIGVRLGVSF